MIFLSFNKWNEADYPRSIYATLPPAWLISFNFDFCDRKDSCCDNDLWRGLCTAHASMVIKLCHRAFNRSGTLIVFCDFKVDAMSHELPEIIWQYLQVLMSKISYQHDLGHIISFYYGLIQVMSFSVSLQFESFVIVDLYKKPPSLTEWHQVHFGAFNWKVQPWKLWLLLVQFSLLGTSLPSMSPFSCPMKWELQ